MKYLKIFSKKAVSIVEVLVAIVLSSIILLSMTKVVALTLKNASESEASDIAIQQFSQAEENFKSWYITPQNVGTSSFLKDFCQLTSSGEFLDITQKYPGDNALIPKISYQASNPAYAAVNFPGEFSTIYLKNGGGLPPYMWVSLKIKNPLPPASPNGTDQIQASTYVHWELNGKNFNYTNTIYLYTGEKCYIP